MIDLLISIAGSFLGATAAGAALWAVLRELLLKKFDQHLKTMAEISAAQLELQKEAARVNIESELAIYPALSELLYRSKLACDLLLVAKTRLDLLNGELAEACRELTTKLVSYRIYLKPEMFDQIHGFKRALQDLLTLTDQLTRPDEKLPLNAPIPQDVRDRISQQCKDIKEACNSIIPILRARMNHLGGEVIRDSR
jgi:undecaprenyl pyrophosphate synthase